jgi:hypothetical protein
LERIQKGKKSLPRENELFVDRTSEEAYGQGKQDAEDGKTEGDLRREQAAQDLPMNILTRRDCCTDIEESYDQGVIDGQHR